ncbi:MAG TPA: GGDEF domain-containing protein, partial [Candidatus Competibacteraceae bacterium]|nr:GGDEF domain-containing protein [Candidatus Competibacteraceae bacterium]
EAAAATEAARRKTEEERARTEFLAWHDPATGLANKAHLKHQFVQAIAAARACHGSFSLLYFRIDNYGELVRQLDGEGITQLLKRLGERVIAHFTHPDDFGRWGDREFMGMLAGAPSDAKFRTDLRRVLNALCEPIMVDGLPLQLTLSLGTSVYPRDGESSTVLINTAIQQAKPVSAKDLGAPGTAEIHGRGSLAPAGGAPAAC